ncbi:uncharacterized protein N7473_011865 [Penicillium subrubescens]|uniref:Uncharacterized protein n=1 Tax=Penicillium subrubescens TaxID=1316194 RepID=A0A1Q5UI59_9EURO|nr:uncharacterized protein N7473_011865 [Penicillium subrubescens]KAJ5880812.1 hypothetical protein N7473_011865 [Penicillium subrubescens]OKP12178.1 hypothetical protein PENSUB_2338 [Penicillium subrubescens]
MSSQYDGQAPENPGGEEAHYTAARNRQEALDGIHGLDNMALEYLIACANEVHPDLRAMILHSIHRVEGNRLSASPFRNLINAVWQSIHGRPSEGISSDENFLLAEEVANEIMATIRIIPVLCEEHANPETHFQALSALRQIGNMIIWAGPTELGLRVRGHFDGNSALERSMLGVVDQMTPVEKQAICNGRVDRWDDSPLLSKIQELQNEGRWCMLYDNMHLVIEALHDTSLPDDDEPDDEN